MISSASVLVSLVAAAVALISGASAVPRGRPRPSLAWAASISAAVGLVAASLGGSMRLLDLAAVAGVVLVGG